MDERNNRFDFDFTPIGQAIKKARESRGMTREELSGIIGYAPRHIQSIENEGQYPSIELFRQHVRPMGPGEVRGGGLRLWLYQNEERSHHIP